METKISPAELAEHLADVLARVEAGGERFVVERDGRWVAVLAPAPKAGITLDELAAKLAALPPLDEDFASDIDAAKAVLKPPELPGWPE